MHVHPKGATCGLIPCWKKQIAGTLRVAPEAPRYCGMCAQSVNHFLHTCNNTILCKRQGTANGHCN